MDRVAPVEGVIVVTVLAEEVLVILVVLVALVAITLVVADAYPTPNAILMVTASTAATQRRCINTLQAVSGDLIAPVMSAMHPLRHQ